MGKLIDLIGKKFGKLLVLNISPKLDTYFNVHWECLCDCGTSCTVRGSSLKNGHTTSCGCAKNAIDETNNQYGLLTVTGRAITTHPASTLHWNCSCACGTHIVARSDTLRRGEKTSCGCDKIPPKRIRHVDETGKIYGNLQVVKISSKKGQGQSKALYWDCICVCGNHVTTRGIYLRNNTITSCGCAVKLPYIDETGNRYGKWTVNALSEKRGKHGQIYWKCTCDCGNQREVLAGSLRNKYSTSCGCQESHQGPKTLIDERGNKYEKLTVIDRNYEKSSSKAYWNCSCACGKKCVMRADKLRSGHAKSCGCLSTFNEMGNVYGKLTVESADQFKGREQHWWCRCQCGNLVSKRGVDLRNGKAKSCCRSCMASNNFYQNAINELIRATKQSARLRNFEYTLTREDHEKIAASDCFYCGRPPSNEMRTYRTKRLRLKYSGIDRINSMKGYTLDNVRPSCITCNVAKADMSEHEFISWIQKISTHLKTNYGPSS